MLQQIAVGTSRRVDALPAVGCRAVGGSANPGHDIEDRARTRTPRGHDRQNPGGVPLCHFAASSPWPRPRGRDRRLSPSVPSIVSQPRSGFRHHTRRPQRGGQRGSSPQERPQRKRPNVAGRAPLASFPAFKSTLQARALFWGPSRNKASSFSRGGNKLARRGRRRRANDGVAWLIPCFIFLFRFPCWRLAPRPTPQRRAAGPAAGLSRCQTSRAASPHRTTRPGGVD